MGVPVRTHFLGSAAGAGLPHVGTCPLVHTAPRKDDGCRPVRTLRESGTLLLPAHAGAGATRHGGRRIIQFDWRRTLTAALSVLALSLPLILKTLSGEIQGRFQMLSVFDDNYVRQLGIQRWV